MNNYVPQVPFSVFTKFLSDLARVGNDPSLRFEGISTSNGHGNTRPTQQRSNTGLRNFYCQITVSTRKTDVTTYLKSNLVVKCPIHGSNSSHSLTDCVKFRGKTFKQRKDYLYKNGYCVKCCGSRRHIQNNYKESVKCGSTDHETILHPEPES